MYSLKTISNDLLASGAANGPIIIFNVTSGSIKYTLTGHTSYVFALELLSDGTLISGSADGTIKNWNALTGSLINSYSTNQSIITSFTLLSNGDLVSTSWVTSVIGSFQIRRLSNWSPIKSISRPSAIRSSAESPDGSLVIGLYSGVIEFWNLNNLTLFFSLKGHKNAVVLKFLTSEILASGSWDRTIKIWNVNNRTLLSTFNNHTLDVYGLAVTANKDLVSCSYDSTIKIWTQI